VSTNPVQNAVVTDALSDKIPFPTIANAKTLTGILLRAKNAQTNEVVTTFAAKGTHYASLSFQLTLLASGWTGSDQIIQNTNLIASDTQYAYIITPASSSFSEYIDCEVYADDITTNQYITFHAGTVPENDLTVNVLRMVTRKAT